jgi:vacuolar protein-sorting-associated protein 4
LKKEEENNLEQTILLYRKGITSLTYSLTFEQNEIKKQILETLIQTYQSRIFDLRNRIFDKELSSNISDNSFLKENKQCPMNEKVLDSKTLTKSLVKWDDVGGLESAKKMLKEAIITPIKYPQFFNEQRKPWSRILIYGPPGTGKTRLAKVIATETEAHFFSASPSDLLSCWFGGSEKLIQELFTNAYSHKQSVIFFDEIDSLCRRRNDTEDDQTRRIKTELLKQMDGIITRTNQLIILASTNRPWELDTAFLRRFEKKIFIPLPDIDARVQIFKIHLGQNSELNEEDFMFLARETEGYSGSDISVIVNDAFMEPIRELEEAVLWKEILVNEKLLYIPSNQKEGSISLKLSDIPPEKISNPRSVNMIDLMNSIRINSPSNQTEDMEKFSEFTKKFGTTR